MESTLPLADERSIDVGSVVANYVIDSVLGRGAEGSVFLARDTLLGRQVALKTLRVAEIGETRGVEEARLLASLEHPHILRVYHTKRHHGVWFVVSEYLGGGSLQARVERTGPLPIPQALELMAQIASALNHVHASGIVHRDVKPQNMLLSQAGQLKLADFGLAADLRNARRLQSTVGTPAFLAPEMWGGAKPTSSADVYSAGVTLFFMLTGRLPFVATRSDQLQRAHRELEPQLPAEIPRSVRDLVLTMMAKRPEARTASSELSEALRRLARHPYGEPSRGRAPLTPSDPFVSGGPEAALREVVLNGKGGAYLGKLLASLRKHPRCVELIANAEDARLLLDLLRTEGTSNLQLIARLEVTSRRTTLLDVLSRRLDAPPQSDSLSALCEKLLEPSLDWRGQAMLEVYAPCGFSARQSQELSELVEVAARRGVVCFTIQSCADGDAHSLEALREGYVRLAVDDVGLAPLGLEGRLETWIRAATGGRSIFSTDALRLLSETCRIEGRPWPILAQNSLLIAAAAGLPTVTTWAVTAARGHARAFTDVDEVPVDLRSRPDVWPPRETTEPALGMPRPPSTVPGGTPHDA